MGGKHEAAYTIPEGVKPIPERRGSRGTKQPAEPEMTGVFSPGDSGGPGVELIRIRVDAIHRVK